MKNCPYCSEQIQDTAVKCRYCGEWLDNSAARQITSTEPQAPPAAISRATAPTPTTQEPIASTTTNQNRLRGFGGWLWVFLIAQFMPLLQFIGRAGDLTLALRNATSLTLFLLGWSAVGILLAFALAFPPHNPIVIWLVRGFIVASIGILIGVVILYGNAIDVAGAVIPRAISSLIWLAYFFVSKRVKATYFAVPAADS